MSSSNSAAAGFVACWRGASFKPRYWLDFDKAAVATDKAVAAHGANQAKAMQAKAVWLAALGANANAVQSLGCGLVCFHAAYLSVALDQSSGVLASSQIIFSSFHSHRSIVDLSK